MIQLKFRRLLLLGAVAAAASCSTLPQGETTVTCGDAGYDRQALDALKASEFELGPNEDADALAFALADCLGSPDPSLRDGIAYEGLAKLLRGGAVSDTAKRRLIATLSERLDINAPDERGFSKPFAVLALSEVARTDRIEPYLVPEERTQLVKTGADYLRSVRDYRGYDDEEGWRHGVAHGADLLMQLALNENVGASDHRIILAAVASQAAPQSTSYIYGESERLARPVLFIAARGEISEQGWTNWFAKIADAAPLTSWNDAFSSREGLAKRHNTSSFVNVLYVNATASANENLKILLPGAIEVLKAIP